MTTLPLQGRTLALLAVIVPLLALFVYVALRSGPLAPVAVSATLVESRAVAPAAFGIGTVAARYTYKIGPTFAGRVKQVDVQVGDRVSAGQVLGEMDPIDLDDRIRSQSSALKRAQALLREAQSRHDHAQTQAHRYEELYAARLVSEEAATTRQHELRIADAARAAAQEDLARARSDHDGLVAQKSNLRLVAPVDGVVAVRHADPGTTIVAGQAVVEVIDPSSLWINVRFDQVSAAGIAADLPASIVLRSRNGQAMTGRVLRTEPVADPVTEEILAKVVFDQLPEPLPPLGELAEVTVDLPPLPAAPVIPNAAVQRVDAELGVWQVIGDDLFFSPVTLGAADLTGLVQVQQGLDVGDRVIVYSEKALSARSRIHLVEQLPGVKQ